MSSLLDTLSLSSYSETFCFHWNIPMTICTAFLFLASPLLSELLGQQLLSYSKPCRLRLLITWQLTQLTELQVYACELWPYSTVWVELLQSLQWRRERRGDDWTSTIHWVIGLPLMQAGLPLHLLIRVWFKSWVETITWQNRILRLAAEWTFGSVGHRVWKQKHVLVNASLPEQLHTFRFFGSFS